TANEVSYRSRMKFFWTSVSLIRSTTSEMVNLRSVGGLMVTLPVGLSVVAWTSPLSLPNQVNTSAQPASTKCTVTAFSGLAAGSALNGWPTARGAGEVGWPNATGMVV